MTSDDLQDLLSFWQTHLRNAGLSPQTLRTYTAGVQQFAAWSGDDVTLTRRRAEAFCASILDGGAASGTAYVRLAALRRFSAWLAEEGEIEVDELATLRSPKVDQKVVDHLTPEEVRALLGACEGKSFAALRDTAIVHFMRATGARSEEVIGMQMIDMQIGAKSCVITRGKGGRGRRSGFGDKPAEAIGRYLRARRRHPSADRPELWLAGPNGHQAGPGGGLTYGGLKSSMERRARAAGVEGFHLHRLRHTAAVDWLRAGGSVPGLMSQCGWISVDMVNRYIEAASSELAVAEAHRLDL